MDDSQKKVALPKYQQVAVEIAERISDKRYKVGDKIHARSTLASNFNVSPETARKAINVLVDLGIMEVRHGSGAYVVSREKAKEYYDQYQDVQSVQEIKKEILNSFDNQKKELSHVTMLMEQMVSQMKRVHNVAPFVPYELELTEESAHLGETVQGLNIWHETGVTIIAIQTETELVLSPGPYARFNANDVVYFVGNELGSQRLQHFFFPSE